MTSDMISLRDGFKNVSDEFDARAPERIIDQLVGMWNKNWMLAKPYGEVALELEKLGKEYKLVLFANSDPFSIKNVMSKFDLDKYFDKVVLSCETGSIKTDEDFFPSIAKDLDLDPKECLVVGDSIQSDLEPAKKSGMNVILIDRRDKRDYEPKIKSLQGLGSFLLE